MKKQKTTSATTALDQILIDVEDVTGVTKREILSTTRGYENVCLARFFVYAMMREHPYGFSFCQIGSAMGRDHGSVLNGIKRLNDRLSWEKALKVKAKVLKSKGYTL